MNQPNYLEMDKKLKSVFDHEAAVVSIWEAADLNSLNKNPDVYPVGFKIFSDAMGGGVEDGNLIVIAGKTGEGKTTFAQTLSYHFNKLGLPMLWFSYEVTILRLREKFRNMGLDENFIAYCPIKLKSGNIDWIEERILEGIHKFNTKVIFLDPLKSLAPRNLGQRNFQENFSSYMDNLTEQIKQLAIQHNLIIFLLANTKKTREGLELEDIKHSGGIADAADFVFMLERISLTKTIRTSSDLISSGDLTSPFTQIALKKNRATGIQKFLKCELRNGRFNEITL